MCLLSKVHVPGPASTTPKDTSSLGSPNLGPFPGVHFNITLKPMSRLDGVNTRSCPASIQQSWSPLICALGELSLNHLNVESLRSPNSISSLGHTGNSAITDVGSSDTVNVGGFSSTLYLQSPTYSTAPFCHASAFTVSSGTRFSFTRRLISGLSASGVSFFSLFGLDFFALLCPLMMLLAIRARTLPSGSVCSLSICLLLPFRLNEMVSLDSQGTHLTTHLSIFILNRVLKRFLWVRIEEGGI